MSLSVKERGETIATFRCVQVCLMEMLAAWVPTTPEMEVKLVLGAHIWDAAQHADALGKRTYELRLPLQFSLRPSEAYADLLAELAAETATAVRIAAFYDVVLPGLGARYRAYLDRTDALMDAPSVRILKQILNDQERMIGESHELRKELPQLQLTDLDLMDQLAARESAIEPFVVFRDREPVVSGA